MVLLVETAEGNQTEALEVVVRLLTEVVAEVATPEVVVECGRIQAEQIGVMVEAVVGLTTPEPIKIILPE
jgi:diaminopimelate decarboxylase